MRSAGYHEKMIGRTYFGGDQVTQLNLVLYNLSTAPVEPGHVGYNFFTPGVAEMSFNFSNRNTINQCGCKYAPQLYLGVILSEPILVVTVN